MSDYEDKIDKVAEENKRDLRKSNARHAYVGLLESGLDEELAYEACKLTEDLHFSACEMWFSYMGYRKLKDISLKEIDEVKQILPKNYKTLPYYSKATSKMLYDVIQLCKKKREEYPEFRDYLNTPHHYFFEHLYQSCTKELFCYRAYSNKELDFLD